MSAVPPPPPPPPNAVEEKPPAVGWLIPLGGVLAVIGAFTPWFRPEITASVEGRSLSHSFSSFYSYKDGKIGLLAPIVLALVGLGVAALMTGRESRRFSRGSSGPVVSAARGAIIGGAISLVCAVVAWFLVTSQYKFIVGGQKLSWDDFTKAVRSNGASNVDLGRGPQVGYFLTLAGAILAVVGGILMLVMRNKPQPVAGGFGAPQAYGAPGQAGWAPPAPQGYGPPAQPGFEAPAPAPYGAPAQSGYGAPAQPGYGAPAQPGYGAPAQDGYGAPTQHAAGAPAQPSGAPSLTKSEPPAGPQYDGTPAAPASATDETRVHPTFPPPPAQH